MEPVKAERLWRRVGPGQRGETDSKVYRLRRRYERLAGGLEADLAATHAMLQLFPAVESVGPSLLMRGMEEEDIARVWAERALKLPKMAVFEGNAELLKAWVEHAVRFVPELRSQLGSQFDDFDRWRANLDHQVPKLFMEQYGREANWPGLRAALRRGRDFLDGLGYYSEVRDGRTYIVAPTTEELKRRWAALGEGYPELSVVELEGIAGSLEFVEMVLNNDIVRSRGEEELHDIKVHEEPTLEMIDDCVRSRQDYSSVEAKWKGPIRTVLERLKRMPERADVLAIDDVKMRMLETTLGANVDVICSLPAAGERIEWAEGLEARGPNIWEDNLWGSYFIREFAPVEGGQPLTVDNLCDSELFKDLTRTWATLMTY